MVGFMFEFLIALIVAGLFLYIVRWVVTYFGLAQPIVVIVGVSILIAFLYWAWGAFPAGGFPAHRLR
jgi:hypothetical protein